MELKESLLLRENNKIVFNECVTEFRNSEQFILYWKKIGLYQRGYHLDQIQNKHRNDAINILAYQFSCSGSTTTNRVFMSNIASNLPIFTTAVDWCIETGLGFVILNKYNKVCVVALLTDICDQNPNPYKSKSKNVRHADELDKYIRNNTIWNEIIGNKMRNNEWKMGEVCSLDYLVVSPSLTGKGLFSGISYLDHALIGMMGYKFYFTESVSEIIIKWNSWNKTKKFTFYHNQIDQYVSNVWNFSNFIFEDSTTMLTYYNKLKTQYGFAQSYIDKVKKTSVMAMIVEDYTKMNTKSQIEWVNVWIEWVTRSSLRSQL